MTQTQISTMDANWRSLMREREQLESRILEIRMAMEQFGAQCDHRYPDNRSASTYWHCAICHCDISESRFDRT